MGKTILIASIIAGIAVMLAASSQLVYAPPGTPAERVTFSFNQASAGSLTMQGGGMWTVVDASSVNAAGGFKDPTVGNWQATTLKSVAATCGGCDLISASSPSSAAFSAQFRDAGGAVTIGRDCSSVGERKRRGLQRRRARSGIG